MNIKPAAPRRRLVDRMEETKLAELKTWEGFAVFAFGQPLPGCLGVDASGAWASVRNHPKQTAEDLRSLGFEVYPVTISVRKL